mmetsp:Transcript_6975/g.12526  ORF Transcript_6975/g.12526 Transcript_6975/m.12526 type:complete len:438 (-) Transcript_6975:253-1566(-)
MQSAVLAMRLQAIRRHLLNSSSERQRVPTYASSSVAAVVLVAASMTAASSFTSKESTQQRPVSSGQTTYTIRDASTRETTVSSTRPWNRSYNNNNNSKKEATLRWNGGNSRVTQCEGNKEEDMPPPHDYNSEQDRYHDTLKYHQEQLKDYQFRWSWENPESRKIPTVSWPTEKIIPDPEDVPALMTDLKFCDRSPSRRDDGAYCNLLRFRLATHLIMQNDENEKKKGLKWIKEMAENGYPDAMCSYGICLNDGRAGLEPNPNEAVVWWRLCCDMYDHNQSMYEMGVAFYTGEGVVENEEIAVKFFRRAAEAGHAGAAYMWGDCLLDGIGVVSDRGDALEWLVTAAELGHRGARSRVLAILTSKEGEDYGRFTDSSRQTFVEASAAASAAAATPVKVPTEPLSPRDVLIERRYTIGGGPGNPVVLQRRQSVVQDSRSA